MSQIHVAICAAGRGLTEARVLAASVREHRPAWPITVLVVPAGEPVDLRADEPFEVLRHFDLEDPVLVRSLTATAHERQEALAGPALVEHLLRGDAPAVLLLAADSVMVSGPEELEALLESHDAVVAPRVGGVLPDDGERPDAADLVEAGESENGFFAVRNSGRGREIAAWWSDRAREGASALAAIERTGDDDAPLRFDATPPLAAVRALAGVTVLEHPGYMASAWNLHERPLSESEGELRAAGEPLRIMRFPRFDPARPWWLSAIASRVSVLDDPILERLCAQRADALLAAGWPAHELVPSGRRRMGNGLRYDKRLRRMHLEALAEGEDFGDVFEPAGAAAFTDWLQQPAEIGARHGLTRYHHDVWLGRPDIMKAYPNLDDPAEAEGFIGWMWVHGRSEVGLDTPLLPPAPDWVQRSHADVPDVLVTGYLRGVVGLGEAGRRYVYALEGAGVRVATHVLPTDPPGQKEKKKRGEIMPFEDRVLPDGRVADVHLLCVNADLTPSALDDLPADRTPPYVIGNWAWETDVVPDRWDGPFSLVDEVWVYSSWIAENISRSSPVPVIVMPMPVVAPDRHGARVPFELPDGFKFLFTFDHFSTLDRKNPLGLIEAFKLAFEPGEGPMLVLKTINADFHPRDREDLRRAKGSREDIHIVDGVIEADELAALVDTVDCYVSLHRAEGFGMTLAEAMALGKPVIATGWSGNTDFTTVHNSYLVDFELRAVGPDNPPYDPDGTWAEPSVEHAASLMRHVWEHPDEARALGERGRQDVERLLGLGPVGARARERLERIVALGEQRTDLSIRDAAPWIVSGLDERLAFDRSGNGGRGARALAKRSLLRALRPFTDPQAKLDSALADAVYRVAGELDQLRAARERDRQRIAALEKRLSGR